MGLLDKLRAANLTERQVECLALYYFDGLSQREIADRLGLNQKTVCQHINAGLAKLKAHDMAPQRRDLDDRPRVLTNVNMDALGPDEIVAVF